MLGDLSRRLLVEARGEGSKKWPGQCGRKFHLWIAWFQMIQDTAVSSQARAYLQLIKRQQELLRD